MRRIGIFLVAVALVACSDSRETVPLPSSLLSKGSFIRSGGQINGEGHLEDVEWYTFGMKSSDLAAQVKTELGPGWHTFYFPYAAMFSRDNPGSGLISEEIVVQPGKVDFNGKLRRNTERDSSTLQWKTVGRSVN